MNNTESSSACFSQLTDDFFFQDIIEKANTISTFLDVHQDVAFLCLQKEHWNEDMVFEKVSDDRESYFFSLGISEEQSHFPQSLKSEATQSTLMCSICFDEYPNNQCLSLPCGHYFCENCWKHYIQSKLDNNCNDITCMYSGCQCHILLSDVKRLLGEKAAKLYRQRLSAISASLSKQVRRCLNPKCNLLITEDQIGLCGVAKCLCGSRICWFCGGSPNPPLKC